MRYLVTPSSFVSVHRSIKEGTGLMDHPLDVVEFPKFVEPLIRDPPRSQRGESTTLRLVDGQGIAALVRLGNLGFRYRA